MKVTFENLKNTCEKYGFDCTGLARSDALPYDQLVLFLGEDEREQQWLLNVRAFKEPLPTTENLQNPPMIDFLNFFITLPFEVEEAKFGEVSRLTALVNRGVMLPGFNLSETDKRLYFQYTIPCNDGEISEDMFLTMIALISIMMHANISSFEAVATGQKTYDDVLEEAYKIVQEQLNNQK